MSSDTPEMLYKWLLGKNISSRNALDGCSAREKEQNSEKAGEDPTFHSRNPKTGETHFVSVSVLPPSPMAAQPLR